MDHAEERHIQERQQLRAAGLRVTGPRVATLAVLSSHPHSTANTVAELVRRRLGHVSIQTIYDVLAACTGAGLVRRIEPDGPPALYEIRTSDHHHHLVCRRCGLVTDVVGVAGPRPCVPPERGVDHVVAGYLIDEHEIVFRGMCPACRASTPTT